MASPDGKWGVVANSSSLIEALTPEERAFSEEDALTLETKNAKKLEELGYRVLVDGLTDPAKRKRLT